MATNQDSVQAAGGTLGAQRHVCALFNSIDEEHSVLRSFFKDGFDHGDKSVHVVDPEQSHDHLARLREAGIDVEKAVARGQLDVKGWPDVYLQGDRFDKDVMLATMEGLLSSGQKSGYKRVRLVADMEWALLDKPGVEDLVEYETLLNHLLPKYDDTVICSYDLSRFGARVIIDIMRTHPVVIVGGVLQENPFFVPPDQFLLEIRERRSLQKPANA